MVRKLYLIILLLALAGCDLFISEDLRRFYDLGDELEREYLADNFFEVEELANEYLRLADKFQDNWNYGNAIHDANMYLGLLALKQNETKLAKEYLLHSGDTPGSPQLNSFGPCMCLVKELLNHGESDTVLLYFEKVSVFWDSDKGRLDKMAQQVRDGEEPKLCCRLSKNKPTEVKPSPSKAPGGIKNSKRRAPE
jgi:hypothetical protein